MGCYFALAWVRGGGVSFGRDFVRVMEREMDGFFWWKLGNEKKRDC